MGCGLINGVCFIQGKHIQPFPRKCFVANQGNAGSHLFFDLPLRKKRMRNNDRVHFPAGQFAVHFPFQFA